MNALLRLPDVMRVTGQRRSTLYLRIKQGLMTRPCKLGERCSAWPNGDINAINAAHIAGKSIDEIRKLVSELEKQRTSCLAG